MENKAYYAILSADVRYDQDLPVNAKILYAEITALCNQQGYCWAQNSYFAELYGVNERSIRRWINILVDKGYIGREIEYEADGKTIKRRKLIVGRVTTVEGQTTADRCHEMSVPTDTNVPTPRTELSGRIINNNIINNNPPIKCPPTNFVRPTLEEIKAYCIKQGYSLDALQFFDFYTSNGWKVGRVPMKDWRAAVRTWVRRKQKEKSGETTAKSADELNALFGKIDPNDI